MCRQEKVAIASFSWCPNLMHLLCHHSDFVSSRWVITHHRKPPLLRSSLLWNVTKTRREDETRADVYLHHRQSTPPCSMLHESPKSHVLVTGIIASHRYRDPRNWDHDLTLSCASRFYLSFFELSIVVTTISGRPPLLNARFITVHQKVVSRMPESISSSSLVVVVLLSWAKTEVLTKVMNKC